MEISSEGLTSKRVTDWSFLASVTSYNSNRISLFSLTFSFVHRWLDNKRLGLTYPGTSLRNPKIKRSVNRSSTRSRALYSRRLDTSFVIRRGRRREWTAVPERLLMGWGHHYTYPWWDMTMRKGERLKTGAREGLSRTVRPLSFRSLLGMVRSQRFDASLEGVWFWSPTISEVTNSSARDSWREVEHVETTRVGSVPLGF